MGLSFLVEILIGTGGWDYFNVPGDKLRNYARVYKTVEVNSTFYAISPLSMVRNWRRRVPEDFEFTVRCSRELTHRLQFKPLNQALEVFESMKQICSVLRANVLHVQTSSTFRLNKEIIEKIDDFLSSINLANLRMAWEIRGGSGSERQSLLSILENHDVIHCVDLSRGTPAYESNIIYSRLFGKGFHNIYQFTNSELEEIDGKVKASTAEKAYLNFHGQRMYKDAVRISIYEASGKFPKITSSIGVDSAIEVMKEDAYFPSTTSQLIKSQGWKVCEWRNDQQLHLSDILKGIEKRSFKNLSELEAELHRLELKSF